MPHLATDVRHPLLRYDGPLNIRELQQCLASSTALAPSSVIRQTHLPPQVRAPAAPPAPSARSEQPPEEQRQKLSQLLEHHQGNVSHVARDLGTSRMQIHRLLQRFGLDLSAFRKSSTK